MKVAKFRLLNNTFIEVAVHGAALLFIGYTCTQSWYAACDTGHMHINSFPYPICVYSTLMDRRRRRTALKESLVHTLNVFIAYRPCFCAKGINNKKNRLANGSVLIGAIGFFLLLLTHKYFQLLNPPLVLHFPFNCNCLHLFGFKGLLIVRGAAVLLNCERVK